MSSAQIDSPRSSNVASRHPAITVAVALGAGILMDARTPAMTTAGWIAGCGTILLALGIALGLRRLRVFASAALGLWFCIGGLRHHLAASVGSADDIRQLAGTSPQLVRLRAIALSSPAIRRASVSPYQAAWSQIDRSSCLLECRELLGETNEPVSGIVRLTVDGHLVHIEAGDEVIVTGWLSRPLPPSNPGEFDFSQWLHRQGVGAQVSADHPDAVRRIGHRHEWLWTWRRLISRLRDDGEALFRFRLSAASAPVASALLLGDRSGLTEEVRTAFAESGMTHLLAISGMNVAILAALVWPFLRLLQTSRTTTAIVLTAITAGYASLADGGPPVVRAALIVAAMAAAFPFHRKVSAANALAVAAIALLLARPMDLFDVGAQLSFLAVGGMIWVGSWPRWRIRLRNDDLIEPTMPSRAVRWVLDASLESCRLMAGIWIFTLPLVIHAFHLVSPAGLFLNIVLIPYMTVVLWIGYLMLVAGLAWPGAAAPFAGAFDGGLTMFLQAVRSASDVRLGHFYVAPPPLAWSVGYYLLVAGLFLALRRGAARRIGFCLLVWVAIGLGIGLRPAATGGFRCTFLSVGHGAAVLLEAPNGSTLLYDAGSLQSPLRAEQAVQSCLWSHGKTGLDAIVVSHADIDHFNGVPGLLKSVPVGKLLVSRTFLDFRQDAVRATCDAAYDARVPIRLIQDGDALRLDDQVRIEALHPPGANWPSSVSDNASSVVLQVEYAGRRILLTGDLEKEGLERLLNMPSSKVDVLQSPHHGSVSANPARLARWASAEFLIVSAGRQAAMPELAKIYGGRARLFSTHETGAVTFTIQPDGMMTVSTLRPIPAHSAAAPHDLSAVPR